MAVEFDQTIYNIYYYIMMILTLYVVYRSFHYFYMSSSNDANSKDWGGEQTLYNEDGNPLIKWILLTVGGEQGAGNIQDKGAYAHSYMWMAVTVLTIMLWLTAFCMIALK